MKTLVLDRETQQAAAEYADNEASLARFPRESAKWEAAFLDFCSRAIGGLSVGRNPRAKKNPHRDSAGLLIKIVEFMNGRLLAGADYRRLESGALVVTGGDRMKPMIDCKGRVVRGDTIYAIVRVRQGLKVIGYNLLKGTVEDVVRGKDPTFILDTQDGKKAIRGRSLYAIRCFRLRWEDEYLRG